MRCVAAQYGLVGLWRGCCVCFFFEGSGAHRDLHSFPTDALPIGGAFTFTGGESERVALVPQLLGIARDFLPFGTGVGSFDQIYRSYETRDGLQFAYLNQAHNEYLQILIEFGIFGVAALVAGLIWYARRAWQAFRVEPESRTVNRQQRAAAMVIVFVVVHSAGDYPLRTAGFAVYFALLFALRSEARRVGTGCRSRWSPSH